jgi:hypothetical protein
MICHDVHEPHAAILQLSLNSKQELRLCLISKEMLNASYGHPRKVLQRLQLLPKRLFLE